MFYRENGQFKTSYFADQAVVVVNPEVIPKIQSQTVSKYPLR